jgi:hypothetical protein
MTITYTQKQAEKIVKQYNKYAKSKIGADKVWCLFHDNSDQEMENLGYTSIEVNRFESIDGCNHTIDIYKNDLLFLPLETKLTSLYDNLIDN